MTTTPSSATTRTASNTAALTTSFTPPSSCSQHSWVSSDCLGSTCLGVYNIVRATESQCYPSGWEPTATVLSPGTLCPSGYYYPIDMTTLVQNGVNDIETQATCCPSGFTIATDRPKDRNWYSREPCLSTSRGSTAITYSVLGATPTTTTTIVYQSPLIHAIPVGIAWQSTDIASAPTASMTTTPTSIPASEEPSSGLSTGAKAGIGVGVSVGVIAIALALGTLFWFRRRGKQTDSPHPPNDYVPTPSAYGESSQGKSNYQTELGDTPTSAWTAELHGDHPPLHELGSK